jgi:hypothetical protein
MQITPWPIFGLESACAPACRNDSEGRDRAQRELRMRGPAALERP